MGIKRSTTYRKIEFEYATDDGDNFLIVYSETDNKQNVSIVKKYKSKDGKYVNKDGKDVNERDKPHSYDVVMWLDIADELRSLVAPQPANLINPSNTISDEPSLVPLISDMRGQQIDQAVAESMTKSTTEATPRESLTVDMAQDLALYLKHLTNGKLTIWMKIGRKTPCEGVQEERRSQERPEALKAKGFDARNKAWNTQ